MITRISNEQPFQVLCSSFSISPSNSGYNLEISADGVNYSPLFTVGAGVTRLVTGVAANSFYRLAGNTSDVVINWQKSCSDGGSGGGGSTYTAGDYISIDQDIISVTGITPDLYLTTADTQDFATEADITAATSPIQEQLDDVERVTASALTELHNDILDLSGATPDLSDYVRINGPVLPLEWNVALDEYPEKVFNAFFTGSAYVYLATVTNVDMWGIIPNDDGIDWTNEFTIDAENKELYVENVPAGLYRILLENTGNDTGSTFFVMPGDTDDETKGIYTHTTEVPGALKPFLTADPDVIIVSDSVDASLAYWTVDKDAERVTIKFEEDPDNPGNYTYHYFITYKPTIDEVAADVNEAFSAITETQQVASAGLNSLQGQINTLSGNTYTKAEVDAEITGATSDMKTYVDNRIDGYTSASTITIGTTPDADGYVFVIAAQGWMGPSYDFYLTNTEYEVATLNNTEIRAEGTTVYAKGAQSGAINYGFDSSAVLTSSMLGQKFSMSTSGSGAIELNETNFPTAYPQYFILDKTNMEGWFSNTLTLDVLVPGVVKSDGEITKVKKVTQAEYDAIVTPDASTLYIIVNN